MEQKEKTKTVKSIALQVQAFVELYQQLDRSCLNRLSEIYHPSVSFTDPLHHTQGLTELQRYFANLYANVTSIEFSIERTAIDQQQACIEWHMYYQHPKLNHGQSITVHGMSWLTFDIQAKIINHHDYFDAGQMLYEHLPLMSRVIRYLKGRVAV